MSYLSRWHWFASFLVQQLEKEGLIRAFRVCINDDCFKYSPPLFKFLYPSKDVYVYIPEDDIKPFKEEFQNEWNYKVPKSQRCPKCNGVFKRVILRSTSNIAYRCPQCLTVPSRYYLDIHYKGDRVRIFSDRQGKSLDTLQRAIDLLSHIQYEIDNHIFDSSKYKKSEQKEFYCSTKLDEYLAYKINSLAPSYQKDFKRHINTAKNFF